MATNPTYSHNYNFIFGDLEINGKVEFNGDGRSSWSVINHTGAITKEKSDAVDTLFKGIYSLQDAIGAFSKVTIVPIP